MTAVGAGSAPQVEISLRLQLGEADHAAFLGTDEAEQQIFYADILRLHGVAAGGELEAVSWQYRRSSRIHRQPKRGRSRRRSVHRAPKALA